MNSTNIIGNLTRDPDLRQTNSGIAVCTFTVAVQRRFTNHEGEREADFIPVVCWRGLAENCGKYLAKGRKVGVHGMIQTRNYEANDGTKRYITEIIADEVEFLTQKQDGQSAATGAFDGVNDEYGEEVDDSDLPFN